MSLSSIKLNCFGSDSGGWHPGWLAHAWPTLSTGETFRVPTELKADAATLYLSAKWTRARFSSSANCMWRVLVVLQTTSNATPGYPGFQ